MGQAIEQAAQRMELDAGELLEQTEIIRYSTTLAMNKLIERKGPKLGLIATEGFEDTLLIGRASQWSDGIPFKEQRNIARVVKPKPLIPKDLTVAVKERIDYRGEVMRPLDEDHFLAQLDALVDRGVRGFVVSLLWSFLNPVHEQRIREIIEQEYNESYLGSMPVFLSSEVSPRKFEYTRTTMTVLNAYLHQSMYEELIGIGQQLRAGGYGKPLMMVHNTGGMASVLPLRRGAHVQRRARRRPHGQRVARPQLRLQERRHHRHGRDELRHRHGGRGKHPLLHVRADDRHVDGRRDDPRHALDRRPAAARSPASASSSTTDSTWARRALAPSRGRPATTRAVDEPTVTDADLVLGYIGAERFHGGQLQLSRRRAERAIRDRVATPLGVDVDEAALLIKRIIDAKMGAEIYKETVLKGYDPRDFVIFAAGGAGPAHCCGYAEAARMGRVVVFPFSSTFCAYGSSTMDVLHVYERSRRFTLLTPGKKAWLEDFDGFNSVVEQLKELALRDFAGEGFDTTEITYELELDMKFGGQLNVKRVASPLLEVGSEDDMQDALRRVREGVQRGVQRAWPAPGGGRRDRGVRPQGAAAPADARPAAPRARRPGRVGGADRDARGAVRRGRRTGRDTALRACRSCAPGT